MDLSSVCLLYQNFQPIKQYEFQQDFIKFFTDLKLHDS